MAHMIDHSKGRAAFAYAGEAAWHRLGTELLAIDTPEEQLQKAGLDYTVREAETMFRRLLKRGAIADQDEFEIVPFAGRKTLYRSDTGAPLSIMSEGYHPVQPRQIFALYQDDRARDRLHAGEGRRARRRDADLVPPPRERRRGHRQQRSRPPLHPPRDELRRHDGDEREVHLHPGRLPQHDLDERRPLQ